MSKETGTIIERRDPPKKYSLSLEEVRKIAKEGVVIPICRTLPADIYTPVLIYMQLATQEASHFSPRFLFESVEGGERKGRWSYIGALPKDGIVVRDDEISERKSDGTISDSQKADGPIDPLLAIQDGLGKIVVKTPGLPPFTGGYVGYLGYEIGSAFEPSVPKTKPDVLGVPDAILFNFDNVVAFDHVRHELKVIGNINVGNPDDLERQYRQATSKIDRIVGRIHSPIRFKNKKSEKMVIHSPAQSNFQKPDYLKQLVEKPKEYIVAGDIIQVVTSQRWRRETTALPFDIYRAQCRVNPSPFMAYLDYGDFQIISASPELLVKVEDGKISTWPLAGTRGRGKTPEEDKLLEEDLKNDPKEKAEHIMLVDLGRNDVGRVAAPGTVKVSHLMEVEYYSHVMHMGSRVDGELASDKSSLDALRSTFPAGTVSGAPKIRAMQIIDELETEKRGPYAGVIGHIAYDSNLSMAITIRTMVYKKENGKGVVYLQAGGGIVYDSIPEAEYQETLKKMAASDKAIDLAEEEY